MTDYTAARTALATEMRAYEASLPLRNPQCRSRFWLHPDRAETVCLFFHGFTAGPYQFDPMGDAFHRRGYNVLVPLLPGHGRAGEWWPQQPPPLPEDPATYKTFAAEWLDRARQLGDRVVIGGLSGGGTAAAWLGLARDRQVDRNLLFAPYLSSSNKVVDLFVNRLQTYFHWRDDRPARERYGYGGFRLPALSALLQLGDEVLSLARRDRAAPSLIISSESDRAVGNEDHLALCRRQRRLEPMTWYLRFDRVLDIPHTMMTQREGNAYEQLLIVLARAFVESDLTWAEIEEIAYRMTRGRPFYEVVAELGLADRAAPDLPAFLTMTDKRAIALARNPNWRD